MSVPFKDHQQIRDLDIEDGVYESVEHVADMLITGSKFFTLGMRAFYVSIPFVFWYFGPVYLVVSTIATIGFMYAGDSSLGANKVLRKTRVRTREEEIELDNSVVCLRDVTSS